MTENFDREFVALWLWTLENGQYVQTRGMLKLGGIGNRSPQFCCMGVACDLDPDGEWSPTTTRAAGTRGWYMGMDLLPPPSVQEKLGLSSNDMGDIATWNDDWALTFPQIAYRLRTTIYAGVI